LHDAPATNISGKFFDRSCASVKVPTYTSRSRHGREPETEITAGEIAPEAI